MLIFNAGELIGHQCPQYETIFRGLRFLQLPHFLFNNKSLSVICDKLNIDMIYSRDFPFTMVREFKKDLNTK